MAQMKDLEKHFLKKLKTIKIEKEVRSLCSMLDEKPVALPLFSTPFAVHDVVQGHRFVQAEGGTRASPEAAQGTQ
jgi:hypothetical protein